MGTPSDIYRATKSQEIPKEPRVVNVYIDATPLPGQGVEEGKVCSINGFDMTGKEVTFTGIYPKSLGKERQA